jgi:acetolactate synthase I/II/III large subunit
MVKTSDYIIQRLAEHGVRHVFMIPGGGAMHLNDSVGKCKEIEFIANHHEQACAIGAEGYARTSGKLGVIVITTGPGGTNALTGVIGHWLDSVPVLIISGQVKFETTIESCREVGLRQLGDQELNIVDVVRPITKFAAMVLDPLDAKSMVDKAVHIATHGRPGPVWLDIPLNVQGAEVDEQLFREFDAGKEAPAYDQPSLGPKIKETVECLRAAKRPVFLAGNGIRVAGAKDLFLNIVEQMGIPVVSSFNGFDLIPTNHPLFVGRIGTIGGRAANFAVQNADVLLSVGSRNNIRQISYSWQVFARAARKIVVDIDRAELNKPTLKPDVAIHSDAGHFLQELDQALRKVRLPDWNEWRDWCTERRGKYATVLPADRRAEHLVNPYYFVEQLTAALPEGALMVAGNGTACVVLFQAGTVKPKQRIFWNSGCASMGYDLPAATGACIASGRRETICITGDGSIQMNIQELQTIAHHRLPIKIFMLNNNGYISVKQTQDAYFNGRHVACNAASGVSFPDMRKIAEAYGLGAALIDRHEGLKENIDAVLAAEGPVLCEVRLCDYTFSPKLSSEAKPDGRIISKPLEDMYPFLPREEFYSNMIIEPLKE